METIQQQSNKKIEGITELRDESATDTRIVLELRRGEVGEVVLNNLYAQTQLQSVFGINMVALVDNEPKVLNLKQTAITSEWNPLYVAPMLHLT